MSEKEESPLDNEWDKYPVRVKTPESQGSANALSTELSPASSSQDQDDGDNGFDFLAYWGIIVKRRWAVVSVVVAALAVAIVLSLMTTPMYRATTTLQIERDSIRVLDTEGVMPVEERADDSFYLTQYELLRSRSLAERVVNSMNFVDDPVFERFIAPSPISAFFGAILGRNAEDTALDAAGLARKEQAQMVEWLLDNLGVEPIRRSRIVSVSIASPDPEISARVANGFAEAFIGANLDRRMDASSFAKGFLETSLADMKGRLEASERALVAFAQEKGIVETDNQSSLASQDLTTLNIALGKARDERIRAESRLRSAQSGPAEAIPEVVASELIAKLSERRSELSSEYQEKISIYKPEFPEMRQLQGRIDEIDRQISNSISTIRSSIEAEYRAAQENERLLLAQMSQVKDDVLEMRNRSIDYNILQREVDTNRQQYEALLQRYKEVGLAGGVGSNNVSIVDRAEVPDRAFKPNLARNVFIGLLLGMLLGVLLAIVVEFFDDTVKAPEDVERKLGLSVLGVIPKLPPQETPTLALNDARSAFAESYRSLRTALQFSTDRGAPRSLFITSSSMGEGKSTTAYTLALKFAQLGKRVLLIDCDLRNPSLHKRIEGTVNDVGLSNYLSGAAKPEKMVISTGVSNLSFAPTGPLPPNPAELLASPRMSALLNVAVHKYDIVILDGPPVMGLADAPILAHLAEGTLLVIEAGETRLGMASSAIKRVQAARARLLGCVLTKFDKRVAGYGYSYSYGDAEYSYGATKNTKRIGRE